MRGGGDPGGLLDEEEASQLAVLVAPGIVLGEIEYQVAYTAPHEANKSVLGILILGIDVDEFTPLEEGEIAPLSRGCVMLRIIKKWI